MGKYTQEQNDAYKDILEAGALAQISRLFSTYDEVEGEQVATSIKTDSAAVVNLPGSTSLAQQFENQILEDFKKGKIRFFYVAAKGLTLEPESGDYLVLNGKVWDVAGATPLNPDMGSTPILYIVGVKASARYETEQAFIDATESLDEYIEVILPGLGG